MPALFFSGSTYESAETDPRIPRTHTWYRLLTCHESAVKLAFSRGEANIVATDGNCELMFDSGAFTAWSKGKEVDYDDLCRTYDKVLALFGKRVREVWLINLDKIPGRKGVAATASELQEAMEVSNSNFEKMQKHFGHHVIPVFHQDEPTSQLRLLSKNAYICLSPRNDLPEVQRIRWSVTMHNTLPKGCRTHGLAATGSSMMKYVPWHSVDSAAWIFNGANGGVMLPTGKSLSISAKSPAKKQFDRHYESLPPALQKGLDAEFRSMGFTAQELAESQEQRMIFNRITFMRMSQKEYSAAASTAEAGGFFDA